MQIAWLVSDPKTKNDDITSMDIIETIVSAVANRVAIEDAGDVSPKMDVMSKRQLNQS